MPTCSNCLLPLADKYAAQQRSIRRSAEDHVVTAEDLLHGLKVVQPSAMKELAIEKPNVSSFV